VVYFFCNTEVYSKPNASAHGNHSMNLKVTENDCSSCLIKVGPYQSVNQSCIFRVVQVIKSLQDPLEVGNNLPEINDGVRERGLEQK